MENKDFLALMKLTNPENYAACLAAMEKYGDNHWWEDDTDDRMFAYYQLDEPRYLSPQTGRLGEALPKLIGRPVQGPRVELHPANLEFLRDEAERAWKHGTPTYTDEEIAAIHLRLAVRMQEWDAKVIVVVVGEEENG